MRKVSVDPHHPARGLGSCLPVSWLQPVGSTAGRCRLAELRSIQTAGSVPPVCNRRTMARLVRPWHQAAFPNSVLVMEWALHPLGSLLCAQASPDDHRQPPHASHVSVRSRVLRPRCLRARCGALLKPLLQPITTKNTNDNTNAVCWERGDGWRATGDENQAMPSPAHKCLTRAFCRALRIRSYGRRTTSELRPLQYQVDSDHEIDAVGRGPWTCQWRCERECSVQQSGRGQGNPGSSVVREGKCHTIGMAPPRS